MIGSFPLGRDIVRSLNQDVVVGNESNQVVFAFVDWTQHPL